METLSETAVVVPEDGFRGHSLATLLRQWADRLGDETALTFLDYRTDAAGRAVSLSWRELDARVSAVALRARELAGLGERAAIPADCEPALVLTITDLLTAQDLGSAAVLAVDVETVAGEQDWPRPEPDDLAYPQYTSGSTRSPAGVMPTHGNVLANARQVCGAYGAESGTTSTVSWPVPRTSSGKISRSAARLSYLDGSLPGRRLA